MNMLKNKNGYVIFTFFYVFELEGFWILLLNYTGKLVTYAADILSFLKQCIRDVIMRKEILRQKISCCVTTRKTHLTSRGNLSNASPLRYISRWQGCTTTADVLRKGAMFASGNSTSFVQTPDVTQRFNMAWRLEKRLDKEENVTFLLAPFTFMK